MSLQELLGIEEEYLDPPFSGEDNDPALPEEDRDFALSGEEDAGSKAKNCDHELQKKKGPFERHHTRYATLGVGAKVMTEHERASVHVYIREDLKRSQLVPFDVFVETIFGLTPQRVAEWTSIITKEKWHKDKEVYKNLRRFCGASKEDRRYRPLCNVINRIMQMAHGRLPGVPDVYPIDDICVEKNDPLYVIPIAAHGKLAANRRPDLLTLRDRHAVNLRPVNAPDVDASDEDDSDAESSETGTANTSAATLLSPASLAPSGTSSMAAASPPADKSPKETRAGKAGRTAKTRAASAKAESLVDPERTANDDDTLAHNTNPDDGATPPSSDARDRTDIAEEPSLTENAAESHQGTPTPDQSPAAGESPPGVHWFNIIMNWELKGARPFRKLFDSLGKCGAQTATHTASSLKESSGSSKGTSKASGTSKRQKSVSTGKKRRREEDDDDLMRYIRKCRTRPANYSAMRTQDKQPYVLNEASIQTGSYALETLACTFGTRLFCVNSLVRNDRLYLWYYDACGFIYTQSISFIEDFAKTAAVIVGMACATPEQLGALPSFIKPPLDAPYPANWPPENLNGHTLVLPQTITESNLETTRNIQATLQESVFSQYMLAGRRTFVYVVKTEPPLSKNEHIIKISYQVNTRRKEHELLEVARQAGVGHLPTVHASADLWKMSDGIRKIFLKEGRVKYEDRTLRAIIYDRYLPLESLFPNSPESIPIMAYQLLDCIHDLRYKANLLHRDIGVNNVMYEYRNDQLYFILIDFDMATEVSDEPSATYMASSKFRTGTLPFMAVDLIADALRLTGLPELPEDLRDAIAHQFCHDVESIYYLTLWCALLFTHTADEKLKEQNLEEVRSWETNDLKMILDRKRSLRVVPLSMASITFPEGAMQAGLGSWFRAWQRIWKEYQKAMELYWDAKALQEEMKTLPLNQREPVEIPDIDLETAGGTLTRDNVKRTLTAVIPDPYGSSDVEEVEVVDTRGLSGVYRHTRHTGQHTLADTAVARTTRATRSRKTALSKSARDDVPAKNPKKRGAPATKRKDTIEGKTKASTERVSVDIVDDDENNMRKRLRPRKPVIYK